MRLFHSSFLLSSHFSIPATTPVPHDTPPPSPNQPARLVVLLGPRPRYRHVHPSPPAVRACILREPRFNPPYQPVRRRAFFRRALEEELGSSASAVVVIDAGRGGSRGAAILPTSTLRPRRYADSRA